jgi:hypothetical protein
MLVIKGMDVDGGIISTTKYTAHITPLPNESKVAFTLSNYCADQWEWQLQRPNGTEYIIDDVSAIGLIFPKSSIEDMASMLRYLADELDKEIILAPQND